LYIFKPLKGFKAVCIHMVWPAVFTVKYLASGCGTSTHTHITPHTHTQHTHKLQLFKIKHS